MVIIIVLIHLKYIYIVYQDNMDTDKPEVDPVTLQNKDGNFPIWMNHRQIRKHKSKLKKKKELKLKRLKSKRT